MPNDEHRFIIEDHIKSCPYQIDIETGKIKLDGIYQELLELKKVIYNQSEAIKRMEVQIGSLSTKVESQSDSFARLMGFASLCISFFYIILKFYVK